MLLAESTRLLSLDVSTGNQHTSRTPRSSRRTTPPRVIPLYRPQASRTLTKQVSTAELRISYAQPRLFSRAIASFLPMNTQTTAPDNTSGLAATSSRLAPNTRTRPTPASRQHTVKHAHSAASHPCLILDSTTLPHRPRSPHRSALSVHFARLRFPIPQAS